MAISAVDPEPKPITIPFFTRSAADAAARCFSSMAYAISVSKESINIAIRLIKNTNSCVGIICQRLSCSSPFRQDDRFWLPGGAAAVFISLGGMYTKTSVVNLIRKLISVW